MVRGIHDIPWIIHHIRSLWWNIMQNIVSPKLHVIVLNNVMLSDSTKCHLTPYICYIVL